MPTGLPKQSANLNFAQGLNTKSDPFQLPFGQFVALVNTVFTNGVGLQKRNGFGELGELPDSTFTYTTTYNNNLTAVGTTLSAYNNASDTWVNKGTMIPVDLETLSLVRSPINQSYADSAISSNGLICTVYQDDVPSGGSTTPAYRYVIADSTTGQNIVAPTTIVGTNSGTVTNTPKVFLLNNYFIMVFNNVYSAADHLEFITISVFNPSSASAASAISSAYTSDSKGNFDGVVCDNKLFIAWNGNDGGGAIRITYIDTAHSVSATTTTFATFSANLLSLGADTENNVVYIAWYKTVGTEGYVASVDSLLNKVISSPTQIISAGTVNNITIVAQDAVSTVFWQIQTTYATMGDRTDIVNGRTVSAAGSAGTAFTIVRSVGLASKAFIVDERIYFLGVYSSTYQPTYFLIYAGSALAAGSGKVLCKLAYQNAGGYKTTGLPNVTVTDDVAQVPYLIKDLVLSVNKGTGLASGTPGAPNSAAAAGIYSQTGINLASFTLGTTKVQSGEIGQTLNLTGGFLWHYDGINVVENGFFLYPEGNADGTISAVGSNGAGTMTEQQYGYQVCYEWVDNNGNIHRSAPSVPTFVTLGAGEDTVTLKIPALRLTYKTNVQIVIYRWSAAQQVYYRITSVSAPTLNSTTSDEITYTDLVPDSGIIGNTILYTTGGVVENTSTPAVSSVALWDNRLFAIDSESQEDLWFSKEVIPGTPVEMSNLLTKPFAPSTGAQGSTGKMKCIFPMDDKLIIFKPNALYYINGTGPDNTGASNQYSQPVLIGATVGSDNPQSIVMTPNGLMFQSNKGIWMLGRDLSTQYIGAAVEGYNNNVVTSAVTVPGTNQVRFTLDSGATLMYDYYYNQWGSFNISGVSSCLFDDLHTMIDSSGRVLQETPGVYKDAGVPVTMSFKTGWINVAGLQGYQRAYFFNLLGTYISPHKLSMQIGYDYAPTPSQTELFTPEQRYALMGDDMGYFGNSGGMGGRSPIERCRVFFNKQKCESFQLSVQEVYDPSQGSLAGAGLTLSGVNMEVGVKKGYRTNKSATSL